MAGKLKVGIEITVMNRVGDPFAEQLEVAALRRVVRIGDGWAGHLERVKEVEKLGAERVVFYLHAYDIKAQVKALEKYLLPHL